MGSLDFSDRSATSLSICGLLGKQIWETAAGNRRRPRVDTGIWKQNSQETEKTVEDLI